MQRAVDAGMVVVAAAGNFGKTADGRPIVGGIVSPGQLAGGADGRRAEHQGHAGAVGRRDGDLQLAGADGMIDGVLKPELVAPGNRIVSVGGGRVVL